MRAVAVHAERAPRRAVALDPVRSGLEALALFFLIQTALLLRSQHLAWDYFASTSPRWASNMVGPIWPDLVAGLVPFAAIALSGIVLAASGRRYVWALPAAAWFAMSFFVAGGHVPHPQPLGMGWLPPFGTPAGSPEYWAQPWAGALVDYGLAMLPAAVIAATLAASSVAPAPRLAAVVAERLRAIRFHPEHVVAFLLCCYLVWLAISSTTEATDPTQPWSAAPALLPPFLFGLLLGTRRPRLLWAAIAVPVLFQVDVSSFIWPSAQATVSATLSVLPFVAMCGVGVAYRPIAHALERLRDAPLAAMILLNVLNVADAVLTWIAVRSHQAVEANPVVRLLGLPAKILIVALIGLILYRVRPRSIVWAVAILAAVIAWHAAGLYLTATV